MAETDPGRYLSGLFGLDGKVAIVTGWAGQLGRQYVKALISSGAKVVGFDLRSIDISWPNEDFLDCRVDITDRTSIENGLRKTIDTFGKVDILVNNAAIDHPPTAKSPGRFEDFSLEVWEQVLKVNITGMFLCCQVVGGYMAENGGGSIVNISSIYGVLSPDQRIYEYKKELTGEEFFKPVAYSVSKSAVLGLTRYLAAYWAKKNVRVNALILGGVFNNQDTQFLKGYTWRVPMGRMAREDEYNGAVIFLASDASSYMTGSFLTIDGGYSAW